MSQTYHKGSVQYFEHDDNKYTRYTSSGRLNLKKMSQIYVIQTKQLASIEIKTIFQYLVKMLAWFKKQQKTPLFHCFL